MSEAKGESHLETSNLKQATDYETIVGTLEQPIEKLVDQLEDKFQNGKYYLLIGDDTSGRLPTLILQKVANYISDKTDLIHPQVRFIQAGRNVSNEDIQAQINALAEKKFSTQSGNKALLITDWVSSGRVMKRLTDLLYSAGIHFDVAALDLKEQEETYRLQGVFKEDTDVFSGNLNRNGKHDQPEIYHQPALVGLQPAMKQDGKVTVIRNLIAREYTAAARRDIEKVADKIIAKI